VPEGGNVIKVSALYPNAAGGGRPTERSMNRPQVAVGLIAVVLGLDACGSAPAAPSAPGPTPVTFDVQLVSSAPPAGATLDLASPNDTPVSLSVTFSVTVPPSQPGNYFWTTAVQAPQPPGTGFVVPVVTTSPLQPVTLVAGTQSITMQAFHTTNAVCYTANDRPAMSTSLDIEIKTLASFGATPFFGKKFPATFALRCR